MTSLPLEKAIGRVKMIHRHTQLSEDCLRELSTFTFDFEKMANVLRSTRPQLFYRVQEIVEQVYQNKYVQFSFNEFIGVQVII